jgi:hypothetical protein
MAAGAEPGNGQTDMMSGFFPVAAGPSSLRSDSASYGGPAVALAKAGTGCTACTAQTDPLDPPRPT